jgi:signal peptidase I
MHPTINLEKNKRESVLILRPKFNLKSLIDAAPIENSIQRGEVISLVSPKDPDECLIKRVIGLPGDLVKTIRYKKKFVTVPEGHLWIEGDNYSCSNDSNNFGCVPMGLIMGKAKMIYHPRVKLIQQDLPKHRKLKEIRSKYGNGKANFYIDFKGKSDEDDFDDEDDDDDEIQKTDKNNL